MHRVQRRESIMDYINENGFVSFAELKLRFPNVSEMTLRTDLKELNARGEIVRVHGGARAAQKPARSDDTFFLRNIRNIEKKRQIAQKAAKYLRGLLDSKPAVSVFLDCGTTITEFAKVFPDEWCTVVTNSISNSIALAALKKPSVTVLGGSLNRYNCCCDGFRNMEEIAKMNFDVMFLPTTGYSPEAGFTCGTEVEDGLRLHVRKKSNTVVMLMDSTKVGEVFAITQATLEDVDVIISDDGLDPDTAGHFRRHGLLVL